MKMATSSFIIFMDIKFELLLLERCSLNHVVEVTLRVIVDSNLIITVRTTVLKPKIIIDYFGVVFGQKGNFVDF